MSTLHQWLVMFPILRTNQTFIVLYAELIEAADPPPGGDAKLYPVFIH